jgi:hypothetical protein
MTTVARSATGVVGVDTTRYDAEQSWDVARFLTPSEWEAQALIEETREQAERIVYSPVFQRAVSRVACALLRCGELTGEQVQTLIEGNDDGD